jgi:hypothetical protein
MMNTEVTPAEMNKLILAGQTAIANCTLGVVIRPRTLTPADEAELEALHALMDLYYDLMSPYLQSVHIATTSQPGTAVVDPDHPESGAILPVTKDDMSQQIKSGRLAIEYCMVGVLVRPRELTEADHAELAKLKALAAQYGKLMSPYELPGVPRAPAANDETLG